MSNNAIEIREKGMKKIINNFYLNKYTLLISVFVAIAGFLFWTIACLSASKISSGFSGIIFLLLLVLLLYSYRKGETNMQKMLLGGLITFLVFDFLGQLVSYIKGGYAFSIVTWVINSIMAIIIFVSHMVQQMDHKGTSASTVVSQCCGVLIIGGIIRQMEHFYNGYITAPSALWTVSSLATYIFIISVETRINEYKKIRAEKRAAACWTEEERQKAKKIFQL